MYSDKAAELRHHKLVKFASAASVTTASLLIIVKIPVWFLTGSLSVLATLIDSIMDVMASVITLIAVRIAMTPADENHHFGHGKAEYLAVLAQSAFIAGSAIVLLLNAFDRATIQTSLVNEHVGVYVMIFSLISTVVLLLIQSYVIRETGSSAIAADAMHYKIDLLTSTAVIIALIGTSQGYYQLDNIFAILISGYMLYSVRKIAWSAIQNLMDQSLPSEQQQEIKQLVLSVSGVKGVHEIRTRLSGSVPFIQMHIDIHGKLTLHQAHKIGHNAKNVLLEKMPGADIIIHLDPN
ncbi:MAG: cation diffusion facilitator family transporter [Candidatus Endonucleobacter bathymodioli]|uniref:Cation diffusion facilitator family transporter n=1 Tax=Candidatus Endonucleibacter bathymodioli TaxID=539814 RepID=A0AA90NJM5_9GAMM|nr:cation diffusion facilitator family transporter [Candidatus Endonucleobacter bathymodioli]